MKLFVDKIGKVRRFRKKLLSKPVRFKHLDEVQYSVGKMIGNLNSANQSSRKKKITLM